MIDMHIYVPWWKMCSVFCARFADFLRPVCGFFALGLRIFCARFADFLRPVCGFFFCARFADFFFARSVCGFFALGLRIFFRSVCGFFALGLRIFCARFAACMDRYDIMHGPPSLDLPCIIYKDRDLSCIIYKDRDLSCMSCIYLCCMHGCE